MKLTHYLSDKLILILGQLFTFIIVSVFLIMLHVSTSAIILVCGFILIISIIALLQDYFKRNRYYRQLYTTLDSIDKKQYIASLLEVPNFADAELLYDILRQATKAMNDEIAVYQHQSEEYREYIEAWIHEVKLPLSCITLLCENSRNEATRSVLEETSKVEAYVEQALFYARSTNVEKDYSIRETVLDTLVKAVVKKHSKQLISCKTNLKISNLNYIVYADPKWLDFILGQVISNSIKYKKEELTVTFEAIEENSNIILRVSDNGIGIPTQDISRVCEKGFTGSNGRKYAKSTGMGLYLCKQLTQKMGLGFSLEAKEQYGTTVVITFPKDKLAILAE